MNFEQAAILLLLAGMLVVFAIDRIRMEVVALAGLAIGLLIGLVAPAEAFSGFSNPAFVTVVEILLIVQVLGRSGILDPLARRIPEVARTETGILAILCALTAGISVFMNNIGALALMIPVATSVCRVSGLDQRRIMMPVSFAALLGGLCSIIGTPANLIVSNQLTAATGEGFAFFDYAWVGVPAAIAGLLALLIWPRRVLGSEPAGPKRLPPQSFRTVVSEVEIGVDSPLVGTPVTQIDATVHAIRRAGASLFFQRPGTRLEAGDVLLVKMDLPRLETWLAEGQVRRDPAGSERVEAVIMPESTLVGSRIGALEGLKSREIRVIAVAMQTPRIEGSLADLQLSIGDVLYLAGDRQAIADAVDEAEILPLWPKPEEAASQRRWRPTVVFAAGVAIAAFNIVPPELAFGLVALILAGAGDLNLRKGFAELDWPILIMLAAMIPLGFAVETTGAASTMASGLMSVLPPESPIAISAAMLALAVAITPFVNNASTAIVLGPIAIGVASAVGMPPEPLLIAVAVGASIDFLTPIGHHNNTIVMGIAGYRFIDFLKVGWPVTIAVSLIALVAIFAFWI
ncbi:SLC13 family permease [Mesorhizobium sp. AaZ16]|uniref:SLC13 family permease n=1 Tax=Mesorhizobium sp. AaZ16 TaxID=3402289 RepID=UPI00374E4FCD